MEQAYLKGLNSKLLKLRGFLAREGCWSTKNLIIYNRRCTDFFFPLLKTVMGRIRFKVKYSSRPLPERLDPRVNSTGGGWQL